MNKTLESTDEGRLRRVRQFEKEHKIFVKSLENTVRRSGRGEENQVGESVEGTRHKTEIECSQLGSRSEKIRRLCWRWICKFQREVQGLQVQERSRRVTRSKKGVEDDETVMEVSIMERIMQEDIRWELMQNNDMCMSEHEDLCKWDTDMGHFDENTSEELDPEKVVAGERTELERFKKMGVNDYEMREVATNDEIDNFV